MRQLWQNFGASSGSTLHEIRFIFIFKRFFLLGLFALFLVACTSAGDAPLRSSKYSRGMRVEVIAETASVILYSDCTSLTSLLVGLANSGDIAVVRDRKNCDDGWWYQVQILALADADWEGIGWLPEQSLKIR